MTIQVYCYNKLFSDYYQIVSYYYGIFIFFCLSWYYVNISLCNVITYYYNLKCFSAITIKVYCYSIVKIFHIIDIFMLFHNKRLFLLWKIGYYFVICETFSYIAITFCCNIKCFISCIHIITRYFCVILSRYNKKSLLL